MSTLNSTETAKILDECRTVLVKLKLSEEDAEAFTDTVSKLLNFYLDRLGDGSEIKYRVIRHFDRAELRFGVKGDLNDPFEEGSGAQKLRIQKSINRIQFKQDASVNYRYSAGFNIVTILSVRKSESSNILKQPMVQAVVGGVVAGLLCGLLPEQASSFIVDEITTPVLSVMLHVMSGILGPIVFLSIVRAVSGLEGIDELTGLGSKVLRRFLITTICITVFANLIAGTFFPVFGKGTVSFDPGTIVDLILGVIPTSFVTPFVENNIPQIVILGIGMGAVLLKTGNSLGGISDILSQLFEWLVGFMNTVFVIIPLVPFLSIFNLVAKDNTMMLLTGWKYIAATYICLISCVLIKLFKVSMGCKISIGSIWKKVRPVVLKALSTGNTAAATRMNFEVSRKELGIDPEFSSFWIPLSNSMFDPTASMAFVLAPFLVADITGTPISISFLTVLMLLAVELSMASPGLTAGYTIIFQSLGLPAEYVGMFSVFSVVIKNIAAACSIGYKMLEQIEIAYKTGNIDMSYFNESRSGDTDQGGQDDEEK